MSDKFQARGVRHQSGTNKARLVVREVDDGESFTRLDRVMRLAGALVMLGAVMTLIKGAIRTVSGEDPSLVPFFGLFATLGLVFAAVTWWRSEIGSRWLIGVAGVSAAVGFVASMIAVVYLVTGTIPETDGAVPLVGASYAILAAAAFLCLLMLGIAIGRLRLLNGRWRWLPIGVLLVQFPIFIVAEAIGEALDEPTVSDGLSMVLTGVAWILLGYAIARQSDSFREPGLSRAVSG